MVLAREVIAVFIITAVWDIVLRLMVTDRLTMFGVENMKWVRVLKPYFEHHTLLAAALIAGFVGAVTHPLIVWTTPFTPRQRVGYGVWVALISGLVGIPMRQSGLFPLLKKHYYDKLGFAYSFATDAMSGVVVAATFALGYQVLRRQVKR